ncbi:unnamed protein product [Prorocentrum cordatum]|uniref:Prohibitin n=1 Tax=Prorocentrum cordatum TaxID=2364126 RepID=A0ABN9PXV6_9DINO|nr:unnamed protein product [Polarella glacialis]
MWAQRACAPSLQPSFAKVLDEPSTIVAIAEGAQYSTSIVIQVSRLKQQSLDRDAAAEVEKSALQSQLDAARREAEAQRLRAEASPPRASAGRARLEAAEREVQEDFQQK